MYMLSDLSSGIYQGTGKATSLLEGIPEPHPHEPHCSWPPAMLQRAPESKPQCRARGSETKPRPPLHIIILSKKQLWASCWIQGATEQMTRGHQLTVSLSCRSGTARDLACPPKVSIGTCNLSSSEGDTGEAGLEKAQRHT